MKKNLITRISRLVAMSLAVAALVACNEENLVDNTQLDAVGISVELDGKAEAVTRAANSLPSGDLKLMYRSLPSTQAAIYTGSGSSWSSTAPLYWQQLASVSGAYPFYAVSPADGSLTAVPTDQSTATAAADADLLLASATPNYKSTITLNFAHALSMVEVNLTNGGGMTDDELSTATLAIDGLQTAYTVAGTTATADGTAATGLKPLKNNANFRFIAPAQELAIDGLTLNFTVTINGEPVAYTYKNTAAHTLVAGKKTVFNISVSKTAIDVAVTVEDWAINETTDATLTIAITGTADEVTGTTGSITELHITPFPEKQISMEYEAANTSHTYIKGNDGTWSSENPIYLDELTANSVLYALAYNKDANGTEIKDDKTLLNDFLGTNAVSVKGGVAAFTLRHLLAQMTLRLVAGEGFTADLTSATINSPTMTFEHKLGTDAEGNMVMNEVTSNSGTYVGIVPEATHIVVPQTLAKDAVFTVKLANGNTYEAKLADDVTLAAGVNTTITLTLMPTKVGVSAAVTPWGEAAVAATVQLAGTNSEVGITGITEAGDLALTYVQNGALTYTATTFSYDGSAWSNPIPLYWDEIAPAAPYTFAALFTPTTAGAVETDYLVGLGTADSHGAQVAMGDLNHAMAKMTITLEAGTNMTAEELAALTKQVTLTKSTAVAVKADGTADITMADAASVIDFTSGTAFFVAPQAIGEANTIVLTRANGNKYTVKLADLQDAGAASASSAIFTDGKIEAGKHYQLTLTVNETSVGITASIAEWTGVNGSGTVTPDFQ